MSTGPQAIALKLPCGVKAKVLTVAEDAVTDATFQVVCTAP